MAWKYRMNSSNPGEVLSITDGVINELGMRIDMDEIKVISLNLKINIIDEISKIVGDNFVLNRILELLLDDGVLSLDIEIND
jgi:hypothetical protein